MRKKIGKRIGPVPIALVAVFALAAFISAGCFCLPTAMRRRPKACQVMANRLASRRCGHNVRSRIRSQTAAEDTLSSHLRRRMYRQRRFQST